MTHRHDGLKILKMEQGQVLYEKLRTKNSFENRVIGGRAGSLNFSANQTNSN